MKGTATLLGAVLFSACSMPSVEETAVVSEQWSFVPLEHAQSFTMERRGTDRRLTVFGPGGRSDTLGVYLMMDSTINGFGLPLERLAVASTTHMPYLAALDRLPLVVGAAHIDRMVNAPLQAWLREHATEFGTADGFDRERLIALRPDALLDYPFGRPQGGEQKNMLHMEITEYLEQHPLGRAEWLRFFGVLLSQEAVADSLFAGIEERYMKLRSTIGDERPKVFFGSAWQGQWFVPPAQSYMGTLIRDAGAEPVYDAPTGTENVAMDLEAVLHACAEADHFGMVFALEGDPDAATLAGGDQRLLTLNAIRNGGFYGNSATSDLFGEALLEPDMVLMDLMCIFHRDRCQGHQARYFLPLAQ